MSTWRTTGSFRQRALRSERATQQLGKQRKRHAAERTHEALERFEERLEAEREAAQKDLENLPAEADLMQRTAEPDTSRTFTMRDVPRSHSQPLLSGLERDPSTRKPPSPLAFYDYGSLTTKPRSLVAQQRLGAGATVRPRHRAGCGFYFPGTQYKHGPYGFSMLEPCLLPPRTWAAGQSVPTCSTDGASRARPLDAQALGLRRNRSAGETVSPVVRSTSAHELRARRTFQVLEKCREEAVLEQARFENGVLEGRWRDPLLDTNGELPEVAPPERHEWLELPLEEMNPAQKSAARILFGLCDVQRRFRGGVYSLFAAENRGGPGVLEPGDFRRGLERLGVLRGGELSEGSLLQVAAVIDRSADGRVRLPPLGRAMAVARALRQRRLRATERLEQQRQVFLDTKYSESLPVDVVKLDKESKSLYNFERSVERFRAQQRALLAQHNELDPHEHNQHHARLEDAQEDAQED